MRRYSGLVLTPILLTLMFLGMMAGNRVASAATVEQLRVLRVADHTRLALDLSDTISYTIFSLDNPHRLVIDIPDSRLVADLEDIDLSSSPINSIRTGIRNGDDLRVVLDLDQSLDYESFVLAANGEFRERLVIDLLDPVSTSLAVKTVKTLPVDQPSERRDILVAVVAGHGGEDPGAPSYDGKFWEKDVTLAIARAMEAQLQQMPGYQPLMIRDGDYSVALKSRPVIARNKRVDAYVSIHADSYRGREVQGVTILCTVRRNRRPGKHPPSRAEGKYD